MPFRCWFGLLVWSLCRRSHGIPLGPEVRKFNNFGGTKSSKIPTAQPTTYWKKPGCLVYIGDEILPSYNGIAWDYNKPNSIGKKRNSKSSMHKKKHTPDPGSSSRDLVWIHSRDLFRA